MLHRTLFMLPLLVFHTASVSSASSPPTPPGMPKGFPAALKPGCLAPDDQTDLYCPGQLGYGCFKIPTVMQTMNGTLLAMIEARKYSCDDQGFVDLVLRRSTDGGKNWEPAKVMYTNSTERHWTTVGDGNFVQDSSTGTIWLIHTRNNTQMFVSHSTDEGATWSPSVNMTTTLKKADGFCGTGHAGGVELSAGPKKGRLMIPVYAGGVYIVYSDDHGASWHKGGSVPAEKYFKGGSAGEWALAETGHAAADGTPILLASVRNSPNIPAGITGKGYRLQSVSTDAGETWGPVREIKEIPEPIRGCEGSLVYHPGTRKLYFSHPDPSLDLFRNRLRVWSSSTNGTTWESHTVVWGKSAGYSSMVVLKDGSIGIFYDRNDHSMVVFEAQSVSWTTFAP